ncbi:MAG: hypothetical protein D6782_12115, partial [Alphaproteobacteria bacterium]
LAALGLLRDVVAFADLLPLEDASASFNQLVGEAYLMSGDFAAACGIARRGVENDRSGYWLQVVALCRALEGNRAGAELALDILADARAPQPLYRALMARLLERMATQAVPPPFLWPVEEKATPLTLALALLLDIAVPPAAIPPDAAMMVSALAVAPALAPGDRLKMAERALAQGTLAAERFRALVLALDGPEGEAAGEGPLWRARQFQMAAAAQDPIARLDLLTGYWASARRDDLLAPAAIASAPLTAAIEPHPDLLAWAPEVVRMLALAGARARIGEWYQMVRDAAPAGDAPMADRLLDIWALAVVADDRQMVPFSDRILDLWYQTRSGREATGRGDRALLFFSVLEGLGYVVPPLVWQQLADLGVDILARSPAGQEWNGLVTAASAGRLGETAAFALAVLGSEGAVGASPEALRSVLESLRAVGLEDEARQLAAEALMLRGF